LAKHCHGLASWAMFQHVAYHLSMQTIGNMLSDFFGIRVESSEFPMIKGLMAQYYHSTFRKLLSKILTGNVLHVDETEVKLHDRKGYVWVFSSLDSVVFKYRPTREGAFLHDLLKDFRGVLVSDFYSAYDGLPCPQQKCLIHLIRDMNQDLLNNPFDEELQSLTRPFGMLLRDIVSTVDQFGLQRRRLKKHDRQVKQYLQFVTDQSFKSEAAEALRSRLLRYPDKLFTFVQHDGVPWNNNCAENAIKRFAYYREGTVGTMREQGLADFLLLLSICHTCRYREVSFLRFMLSQEKNIDRFCAGRRLKKVPSVDLYPRGFITPFFSKHKRVDGV
jgi:hypothetical protein